MFAYCNNNPVNGSDPTGSIPVLDGFIHREVLKDIRKKNPTLSDKNTCVRYRNQNKEYTGKWGFCDLYNTVTGEVWELKKDSNSRSCRTDKALEQLNKYVNGTLLWTPALNLKKPYITKIPETHFKVETLYCTYEVDYWDESNGILRYDYSISINAKNVAQTIMIIGLSAFGGFMAMGSAGAAGLGGLLPA